MSAVISTIIVNYNAGESLRSCVSMVSVWYVDSQLWLSPHQGPHGTQS